MPTDTWIAYLNLGDGVVVVLAESDKATERYGSFLRQVKHEIGHADFEITYRIRAVREFPEAMAEFDDAHRS